jgi:hypothetical protein
MKEVRLNWAKGWKQYRDEIDKAELEHTLSTAPLFGRIKEASGPGGDLAKAAEARQQLDEARRKLTLAQKKALDKVKMYIELSETSRSGVWPAGDLTSCLSPPECSNRKGPMCTRRYL